MITEEAIQNGKSKHTGNFGDKQSKNKLWGQTKQKQTLGTNKAKTNPTQHKKLKDEQH